MESFTLLKYWRGGGAVSLPSPSPPPPPILHAGASHNNTTTIVTSAFPHGNAAPPPSTDDEDASGDGDDGSFFDLEFAVGEEGDDEDGEDEQRKGNSSAYSDSDGGGDGEEGEFDFTLSSASSCNDRAADPNSQLSLSPSDEMFFKGTLVPMMESSDAMNPKSQRIPVSLIKSATKFRVFLLGFKKSNKEKCPGEQKSADFAGDGDTAVAPEQKEEEGKGNGKQGKLFTVKFKVEEVPIVSLFTRDNSSKSGSKSSLQQQQQSGSITDNPGDTSSAAAEERQRFSKEALQKYLKKVKPLYVRVSKRYGEKLGFSGQLSLGSNVAKPSAAAEGVGAPTAPAILKASPSKSSSSEKVGLDAGAVNGEGQHQMLNLKGAAKQGNLQAGLRVMCKHLGKSRSASSAVAAAPPPPTAAASNRRDDSLLEQQDGIQSAILHCKRSFNASRDSEYSRSASEPSSPEKSGESSRKDSGGDDGKASSGSVVV